MLEETIRLLDREYGRKTWTKGKDALSNLVATILSQNTSDINSHMAFRRLKLYFSSWEEIAEVPENDIAVVIRSGGLAETKARRIKQILRHIRGERGNLELDFLSDLHVSEAKQWLRSLPGVGPKTVACVLLFSFGMPIMPVDTHVYRVSRRLGIIPVSIGIEKAHDLLDAMVDPRETYSLHINMIEHGRRVCRPQRPLCQSCVLEEVCPSSALKTAGPVHSLGLAPDQDET